jgi:hypothetical protein
MIETLIVSNLLAWCAVIALAVVALALSRQIGILYERIAPMGADARRRPAVGSPRRA